MKSRMLYVIALLMAFLVADAQEMQDFTVNVGDFTSLTVVDDINVEYRCNPDSTGYAKFSAFPAMANQLIFTNNKKGKLSITVGTDSVYNENLPDIVVYSAYLQSADNLGDSTLIVRSVAPAPHVKFKLMDNGSIIVDEVVATTVDLEILTGKGNISVKGKCTGLNVKNTGKGTIRADELIAENVNCRILGTGKVYCRIDGGKLSIKGSGTGKLYYRGKPAEIKSFQLGTIKAISLDEDTEKKE